MLRCWDLAFVITAGALLVAAILIGREFNFSELFSTDTTATTTELGNYSAGNYSPENRAPSNNGTARTPEPAATAARPSAAPLSTAHPLPLAQQYSTIAEAASRQPADPLPLADTTSAAHQQVGEPEFEPGFSSSIDIIYDPQLAVGQREVAIESLADSDQPYYDQNLSLLALSHVLQDPNPLLRSAAIDSLSLIQHPQATQLLLQALEDPDPQLREDALYALLDQVDSDQVRILVNALGNGQGSIRQLAAEAISNAAQ